MKNVGVSGGSWNKITPTTNRSAIIQADVSFVVVRTCGRITWPTAVGVVGRFIVLASTMNIPKKKYRDKVRSRLELVQRLFADRQRVEDMMQRVFANSDEFGKGSDFHNKIETLYMLLNMDVPALLDALDKVG
jgi:hypothetical protein